LLQWSNLPRVGKEREKLVIAVLVQRSEDPTWNIAETFESMTQARALTRISFSKAPIVLNLGTERFGILNRFDN